MTTRRDLFKLSMLPIIGVATPAYANELTPYQKLVKACQEVFGDRLVGVVAYEDFSNRFYPNGNYSIQINRPFEGGASKSWAVATEIVSHLDYIEICKAVSLTVPLGPEYLEGDIQLNFIKELLKIKEKFERNSKYYPIVFV